MSEFEFPQKHKTRVVDENGILYEETVTPPVCAFCFDVRVIWDYETDEYHVDSIGFASAEGWALCGPCAELVEKRLLPELTARILRSWKARGRRVAEEDVNMIGVLVQSFFDHLHPGRVAFG